MQDMKSCQFCGSDDLDIAEVHDPMPTPVKQKYVYCENCGACGPLSDTFELAILKWNNRIQEAPEMPQERPQIFTHKFAKGYICPIQKVKCFGRDCMMWVSVGENEGRCGLVNTMYIKSTVCGE